MIKEELIDRYLAGELNKEEESDFEKMMDDDPSIAKEVEFRKELKLALKKSERIQIKEMLSDSEKPEGKSINVNWPMYLAAASVAFIFITGLWFFVLNDKPDPDELYTAYYAPYENVVQPIERSESIKNLETEAFLAYEEGDYNRARALFTTLEKERNEPYLQLYLGVTLMSTDDHPLAIDYFIKYIQSDGKLKDRAMWYLSLAYLKTGETEKTVRTLEDLIELDGYNRYKAEELLSKID
ncbi:tetratricopeptide repeat protein [Mangrovivirga sp. M17]|uniref:Tetratricopeptide repeat protein n=1 Tax=Mangrovivirga halotolerans TaxID=2993936 RepID=A0ABT3RPY6_9BACT|nr:tetratricopeptide repeat protein [Mangrovivirga halotolerans]MCX2743230.1 tetratricopeptide repeat protein [Mangrovivirga halotolerans]